MTTHYRSVLDQAIHYFSRPHSSCPQAPLAVAAAWHGQQISAEKGWRAVFTDADVAEIESAIRHAKATGKPDAELTKADFPLPTVAARIAQWRKELSEGRGFQLISGIPVARWGQADCETFFWCFGLHLGIPGAQNDEGHLLGHVIDLAGGKDTDEMRLYKTNANIEFHCDAADVVGLLCLKKAKSGGASRIVSSVAIYNEIVRQRPDLIDRLYQPMPVDTFGEGGVHYFNIPPCRFHNGKLKTFYHADYFRSVRRYQDVPDFDQQERELLDLYQTIASDPSFYLDMELQLGDIQLVSNHTVLHARTDYEDHEDPAEKRHLLRLWTSLPEDQDPTSLKLKQESTDSILASMDAIRSASSVASGE